MYCLLMPGCNDITKPDIIIKDAHLYLPLKGAEMAAVMGADIDACIDVINQGKDWFLIKNPSAYMKLLD